MASNDFSHVTYWVFDLDNTLYHPSARLFDQIEVRMTRWVMDELQVDHAEADRLRKHYWREHGTTLAGLMQEHGVDPEPYLVGVHDISLDHLTPDPDLATLIANLNGRKTVYTNGSAPYAERVLKARGLLDVMDAIYGVEDAAFRPKPEMQAFEMVFAKDGIDPTKGAMFEDEPRNLAAPFDMGMRTIHVADDPVEQDHIHHHTDNLGAFLKQVFA